MSRVGDFPPSRTCYGGPRSSPKRGREERNAGDGRFVGVCAPKAQGDEVFNFPKQSFGFIGFIFGNDSRWLPTKPVMKSSPMRMEPDEKGPLQMRNHRGGGP
jgi:hypothetical protein